MYTSWWESIPLALQLRNWLKTASSNSVQVLLLVIPKSDCLTVSFNESWHNGTNDCYVKTRCFMSKLICVCRWCVDSDCTEMTVQLLCSGWSLTLSRIDEAGKSPTQMRCIATNSGNLFTPHIHTHKQTDYTLQFDIHLPSELLTKRTNKVEITQKIRHGI